MNESSRGGISAVEVVNVTEVDHTSFDLLGQKAVLAMKATKAFVDGASDYESANAALKVTAAQVDEAPTATYADLIFANPVMQRPMVMSDDPEAASYEGYFYKAHRIIEGHLYAALGGIVRMTCSQDPVIMEAGAVLPHPEEVRIDPVHEMSLAVNGIIALHKSIDRETFGKFRPYFVGLNGYPGASGLYSESIPIIDLLTHGGSNIDDSEHARLSENLKRGLYPNRYGMKALLKHLLQQETPGLELPDEIQNGVTDELNRFRVVHNGSVKKLLPEVHSGNDDGSGGVQGVADYLRSKKVANGVQI